MKYELGSWCVDCVVQCWTLCGGAGKIAKKSGPIFFGLLFASDACGMYGCVKRVIKRGKTVRAVY